MRQTLRGVIVLSALLSIISGTSSMKMAHAEGAKQGGRLKTLHKVYLSVHGLDWIDVTEDDPRRKTALWEQFPGRCAMVHPLDFEFRLRIYQMIDSIKDDEALFILPGGSKANDQMIAYARQKLGPRCAVCESDSDRPRFIASLGQDFSGGVEEDRMRALKVRADGISDQQLQHEMEAWQRSKSWAANLYQQLRARGYRYDPSKVEFVCWGGDWAGCAATYPIQMGRAFGLSKPIERRWDLIIRDESPLYVKAQLIVGGIPMPENIRLYIFKSDGGRYCAEYWEGIHGPMDRAHSVSIRFPPDSVRLLNWQGKPIDDKQYGEVIASVGCGGHTPHRETIIEATGNLTLDAFHEALVAGVVQEKPLAKRQQP